MFSDVGSRFRYLTLGGWYRKNNITNEKFGYVENSIEIRIMIYGIGLIVK